MNDKDPADVSVNEDPLRKRYFYITDTINTFLMYDLDSPGIAEKVKECHGEMICCDPCIELWFFLHEKDQYAGISTISCLQALK